MHKKKKKKKIKKAQYCKRAMRRIFSRVGTPRRIVTDNHKTFRSKSLRIYQSIGNIFWNYHHIGAAVYTPTLGRQYIHHIGAAVYTPHWGGSIYTTLGRLHHIVGGSIYTTLGRQYIHHIGGGSI